MTRPPLPRSRGRRFRDPAALRPADQPFLPEGSQRQLRQACADPDPRAHEFRGDHARTLAGPLLGRKPARRPPPFAPMPEVVGITVHLTFAERAFELARWYRSRGSKVVLGGLHVLSCPGRVRAACGRARAGRWRAALAADPGRRGVRLSAAEIHGNLRKRLSRGPAAPPVDPAAKELPHHHQPDRHPRLPQPLRVLLSGNRRPAHALSHAGPRPGRRRVRRGRPTLRRLRR